MYAAFDRLAVSSLSSFDELKPCPDDFDAIILRIGRVACEQHYSVGRIQVTHWLYERGGLLAIRRRAESVKRRKDEHRISRADVRKALSHAMPIRDRRRVNPLIAQRAAHYLREVRHGGWIVSPTSDGNWRLGMRVCSPAELVDFAKAKGFVPPLRPNAGEKVQG